MQLGIYHATPYNTTQITMKILTLGIQKVFKALYTNPNGLNPPPNRLHEKLAELLPGKTGFFVKNHLESFYDCLFWTKGN